MNPLQKKTAPKRTQTKEEILQEMNFVLKRALTEILLEVTSEEIQQVIFKGQNVTYSFFGISSMYTVLAPFLNKYIEGDLNMLAPILYKKQSSEAFLSQISLIFSATGSLDL